MDQNKILSYFQSERVDIFSGSIPRLRYLANEAKKIGEIFRAGST